MISTTDKPSIEKPIVFEDNIFLINKPYTWTSFDVVKKLRGILKIKKIGHAGTLDPFATGLLIICTGKKTKTISHFQDLNKIYRGELILGKTTPSYDLETEFETEEDISHITEEDIFNAKKKLTGWIHQTPPIYSAVKVKGTRLYRYARKMNSVDIPKRIVNIIKFDIIKIELPVVSFEITCSKGTYIRSIASDMGKIMGVGACLSSLHRTQIGKYNVSDAFTIETN